MDGVAALLQWVCFLQGPCGCRWLTWLRKISHREGAGIDIQSFLGEQGEQGKQDEEQLQGMLPGVEYRGHWEFPQVRTFYCSTLGFSPLKRQDARQDDRCTI